MTDSFSRAITISITLHVALFLVFVMRTVMMPQEAIELREAIRVDVVGLPEKEQELPPAPAPPPVAKPEPKPPPPPVAKAPPKPAEPPKVDLSKKPPAKPDNKKAQKHALDEIKAMAALDKIQNEVSIAQSAQSAKPKPVKGNRIASGDSLTGLEKIDFDRYFKDIEGKIRENWSLPQWLIDAHFRAQALVLIDNTGQVIKRQIVTSSGNAEFDEKVLEAIDKSAPFTAPPERLRDVLSARGIVFNFPQRGSDT